MTVSLPKARSDVNPRSRWHPASRQLLAQIPAELQPQLLDASSLTAHVQAACARQGGQFNVAVLSQRVGRPGLEEGQALAMPLGRWALLREVQLRCDQQVWVFARTVMPLTTLHGEGRRLSRLGRRPLGAALFADPHVSRSAMQLTRLQAPEPLYRRASQDSALAQQTIWGRRSTFRIGGQPLLVAEFFLPACPQLVQPQLSQKAQA